MNQYRPSTDRIGRRYRSRQGVNQHGPAKARSVFNAVNREMCKQNDANRMLCESLRDARR
jgi:hypothetical protein